MKRLLPCYLTATVLVAYSGNAFVVNPRYCQKNGSRSLTTFVDTIATTTTTISTRTGRRADVVKKMDGAGVVVLQATEWREYVPLIVSGAVIIDIVAGSPFVNAVLSFARPKDDIATIEDNDKTNYDDETTGKERIDTKKVAAAAVERAQSVVAVRQMLEDNKTDWDRIKDLQRKVEQQQAEFDRSRKKK
jgi:hypothetical protein